MQQNFAPAPDYRVVVNGVDISAKVRPRLIGLTLTEGRENSADQLDLEIDDSDGQLTMPSQGAVVHVAIGWVGQPLHDKGSFVVDEVEHTGAPDKVTIRARAADMTGPLRTRQETSWHETTLGQILGDIAQRNGLTHKVDAALAAITVPHLDQTNESDMHFITRLARQHDAVATVKNKHLLFLPINNTVTSRGQRLPTVHITRADGDQHRWSGEAREAVKGVRAWWSDGKNGTTRQVIAGEKSSNIKTLKETYSSEADALQAAKSEMQRASRGAATFELTLALGRPEIKAQSPISVNGWKPEIDGTDWLVKEVVHTLADGSGWTTKASMERGGSDVAKAEPKD